MENKKRNIVIGSCLFLFSFGLFGQGDIRIDVRGNRSVEKASRLTESPKIVDTITSTPVVDFPRLNLFYQPQVQTDTIQAAGIRIVDKLSQIYHSYLKLGVGSELMPMGEFYFNQTRSRKYKYGVHLQHLSSYGNLPEYAPARFDRNSAKIYGGIIENKYDLDGAFRFRNDGFGYYGFKNDSISSDSINQRFSDIGFEMMFKGHPKDSGSLNYYTGFNYNHFNTLKPSIDSISKWNTNENYFQFKSGAWYKWGKEIFAGDLNIQYNQYQFGIPNEVLILDTGKIRRNTVVSLSPSATTFGLNGKFRAKLGLDLTIDNALKARVHVYPILELKYSLFNDILIPYVSVTGGLKQQSFKSLSSVNSFILPNIDIRNEHRAIDFQGGIKGTVSKRVGFNLGARFAHFKDMVLFVIDTLNPRMNQFRVIYDTVNLGSIEGSIYYQMTEKLKVEALGRYNSYTLLNNSYAWHMPNMELMLRGKYNLFNKLVTQLDVTFLSGRKALVYKEETDTFLENNQWVKNLGLVTDINLSVEYLYNNRISAFLQLNNAAAQRYLRWYNYPVQAFQVFGGFTFKF